MRQKAVHDLSPKSLGFDGEVKQEEGDGAATTCTPPVLTNGTHDPVIPADPATASAEKGENDQPQCDGLAAATLPQVDGQPEDVNRNENHEEAERPQVHKERVNDSTKEKRLSDRLTLLRSCSVDNIDLLYRGHENPTDTQPQKSSKKVNVAHTYTFKEQ